MSSLFITGTLVNCRTHHVDRFIMFKGINCSCAFYSSLIFILKTKLWIVVAQPSKRVIVVCYDTLLFYTNFILPVRSSISTLKIITILLCMYMHQLIWPPTFWTSNNYQKYLTKICLSIQNQALVIKVLLPQKICALIWLMPGYSNFISKMLSMPINLMWYKVYPNEQ